jgi:hypothetical protein
MEHHITRVVDIEGEKLTITDAVTLQTYRAGIGDEVLECDCAFDVIESAWYVRSYTHK